MDPKRIGCYSSACLNWIRIWSNGELPWTRQWTFGSIKGGEFLD